MSMGQLSVEGLPSETQQTLRAYMAEVAELLGDAVEGIILYGSAVRGEFLPDRSNLNLLFVLKTCQPDVLQQYAKIHRRWSKEQIVVPLFMTERELAGAASVFPLEYTEIQTHHRLLVGRDPLIGLQIDPRHLAVQVEQGLQANLIRLRQRYVEGGATQEAATILLPLSFTSIVSCLRGLQRLLTRPVTQPVEALLKDIETTLSLDLAGLYDALNLRRGLITPGPAEVPRMFRRYVTGVETLVERFAELKQQRQL